MIRMYSFEIKKIRAITFPIFLLSSKNLSKFPCSNGFLSIISVFSGKSNNSPLVPYMLIVTEPSVPDDRSFAVLT